MSEQVQVLAGSPGAFLEGVYREALDLVWKAKLYIGEVGPHDSAELPVADRLAFSLETVRLTARLTHAMSWLFYQRALDAGEISREAAAQDAPDLGAVTVCLAEPSIPLERLPAMLVGLLEKSERLYARLARLDAQARRPRVTLPVAISSLAG